MLMNRIRSYHSLFYLFVCIFFNPLFSLHFKFVPFITKQSYHKLNAMKVLQNADDTQDRESNIDILFPSSGNYQPYDAENLLFVGEWKYWYRRKGMQTSTDDVLVAFISSIYHYISESDDFTTNISSNSSKIETEIKRLKSILKEPETIIPKLQRCKTKRISKYIDLGCGIGSTLLLVTHKLKPTHFSLGFEVQHESVSLAQKSVRDIKAKYVNVSGQYSDDSVTNLFVYQYDIRNLLAHNPTSSQISNGSCDTFNSSMMMNNEIIYNSCDLVTANPPYLLLSPDTKSIPKDPQRRSARFEYHGGVNEYCSVAARLLSPRGRFVMSFWYKDRARVYTAARNAGLCILVRVDVLMGRITNNNNNNNDEPYLSIFQMILKIDDTNKSIIDDSLIDDTVVYLDLRVSDMSDIHHTNQTLQSSNKQNRMGFTDTVTQEINTTKTAVGSRYKAIQKFLEMQPRPLKRSIITSSSSV